MIMDFAKWNLSSALKFSIILILSCEVSGQCPGSATCSDAIVYCSLDELNGLVCNNAGGEPSICRPLCARGDCGYSNCNASWWGFITEGGSVTFTLKYGPCVDTDHDNDIDGLLWGISGDCRCQEEICCTPSGHPIANGLVFTVNLKPCKVYYLWVSGFEDDICDFTFSNSGGGIPALDPLGYINNEPSGIIQPICKGECNYKLFINKSNGSCSPTIYEWTLNGIEVGNNSNEIRLDFPDEGDFEICVKAYTGNPNNTSRCSEVGPKCATVKVRSLADKAGVKRTLCYDEVGSTGYQWHSQIVNASGIYRQQLMDAKCCTYDSVVEFIVLQEPNVIDVYYITCDNKPYVDILNGRHYPCQNHQEINLYDITKPFKCDSSIRLTAVNVDFSPNWMAKCMGAKIEISPNINIVNPCDVGEVYQFEYNWYKKSDPLKKTISKEERILVDMSDEVYCIEVKVVTKLDTATAICSKIYCESIMESEITGKINSIQITACDTVKYNGQIYTESTKLNQQFRNIYGCDSVINTDIDIHKSSQSTLHQAACDSILLNQISYKKSGNYKQILIATNGCDSTLNLDLNIGVSSQASLNQTTCDSFIYNNVMYKQTGNYRQTLQNSAGCDSIIDLHLIIHSGNQKNISLTECDSVIVNGIIYKTSGDYLQSYQTVNGCDSIVKIHVNIPKSNEIPYVYTACDSITINGTYYSASGKYKQQLTSVSGCDSTLYIELSILGSTSSSIHLTSCDSAIINGQKFYQSGQYKQLLKNVNQCDSSLNLDLQIQSGSRQEIVRANCDSILVNGQWYKQSGEYSQLLKNSNQCDSLLTIHYTRLSSSSTSLKYNSCDSIKVNNQVYRKSGNYTQTLLNANQCDSILNLEIGIQYSSYTDIGSTACDSVIVNGEVYYQSGKYTQFQKSTEDCDSILNLLVNILESSEYELSKTACDSVIVNGMVYYQSGKYMQSSINAKGCDSTINLKLTIMKSSVSSLNQKACDSAEINGIKYYSSGHYIQTQVNSEGCDSTINLELTIKSGNNMKVDAGKDTLICEGGIIKLQGNYIGAGKLIWQTGQGSFDNPNILTPIYYPAGLGENRLYLQATADCGMIKDSLTISIFPNQIIRVTGDTIIDPCKEITFTASGGINYIWKPAKEIDCLDPPCSKVKIKSTEVPRFTISANGPCVIPAVLTLTKAQIQSELYIPNAFSPNGDNINDIFQPVFYCDAVTVFNMQIFDRWGNMVFETNDRLKGWNGKYGNVSMMPGVYLYTLEYKLEGLERKVKAGEVTLIR
jgi:gliding motility-associated-like protein